MSTRTFIFTVTTGRSGTSYLAELLRSNMTDAATYHERAGFLQLGVDSPDASHFTLFNSAGNVAPVRDFWRRKFSRILAEPNACYIETSHLLAKAGLLENIDLLAEYGEVKVILLTRDIAATVRSFVGRHDFANTGFTWLWSLDYRYPNKIADPGPLQRFGQAGHALWYVIEMRSRGEYYRRLLEGHPKVRFVDADLSQIATPDGAGRLLDALGAPATGAPPTLPGRVNEYQGAPLAEATITLIDDLLQKTNFDPGNLARAFIDVGRRLADGDRQWRERFDQMGAASN